MYQANLTYKQRLPELTIAMYPFNAVWHNVELSKCEADRYKLEYLLRSELVCLVICIMAVGIRVTSHVVNHVIVLKADDFQFSS